MILPAAYAWLAREGAPRMLVEALKLVGTLEVRGSPSNPTIIKWADEIAAAYPGGYNNWAASFYDNDGIPWCGLGQAIAAVRAGRAPPDKYLSAGAWASWGNPVALTGAMLGDILVFDRAGGHHVAQYVAEDKSGAFHILGANQSDAFNIRRKLPDSLVAVRRAPYNAQPANVRKIFVSPVGALSTNEA